MTTINKRKMHFIPNFEASSVVLVAALAVGALGAVTAAHAQTTPPAGSSATPAAAGGAGGAGKASAKDLDAAFARADANKDGKLDKKEAEMMPAVSERFGQLDADSDGFISREEFSKAAGN
jgi:predicted lipid-binding transport protein (Tim44 family)